VTTFVNDKFFQLVYIDQREIERTMAVFRKKEALIAVIPPIYGICIFVFIMGFHACKFVSFHTYPGLYIPLHGFMNTIFFLEVMGCTGYSLP
jgi:hypothetical protein